MSKYTDCATKLEHLEPQVALHQIYEWTKTGHINLAEFKGLVAFVFATSASRPVEPRRIQAVAIVPASRAPRKDL